MNKLVCLPADLHRSDLERRLPRNPNFRNRTGEQVHGCTVLSYAGILKHSFSAWLCRCRCGKKFITSSNCLNLPVLGCGCRRWKHNLSATAIYDTWHRMLARCYQPKDPSYRHYGGMGIRVCRRWRESVENFVADVGQSPSPDHVFQRIDASGNFTPKNCHWVKRSEAKGHGYRRVCVTHQGETLSVREWAKRLGITRQALAHRLRKCREAGLPVAVAFSSHASGTRWPKHTTPAK